MNDTPNTQTPNTQSSLLLPFTPQKKEEEEEEERIEVSEIEKTTS
jgi:hypothetical protein